MIYKYKDANDNLMDLDVNISAINNALHNLFTTQRGSFPSNPDYGTDILKLVFEDINQALIEYIKEEIKTSIKKYEKRINIDNIEVIKDEDLNKIDVKVYYTIKLTNEKGFFNYELR